MLKPFRLPQSTTPGKRSTRDRKERGRWKFTFCWVLFPPLLNLFFYTFSLLIRAPSNIFPLWHLQTYLAFVDPLLSFPASLPSTQLVPLHFSPFSCHRTFQAFGHSLLPFLIPSLGVSFLVSGPITHIPIHITIHEWQWGTGIHMWERICKTFFSLGWNVFSHSYITLVTRVNVEMTKHHLPLQTLWQLAKTQVDASKTMCWGGFLFRFPSPSCLCSCLLKVPSSLFRQLQPVSSNLHPHQRKLPGSLVIYWT